MTLEKTLDKLKEQAAVIVRVGQQIRRAADGDPPFEGTAGYADRLVDPLADLARAESIIKSCLDSLRSLGDR